MKISLPNKKDFELKINEDFIEITRKNIFTSENNEHFETIFEFVEKMKTEENKYQNKIFVKKEEELIEPEDFLSLSHSDIKRIIYTKSKNVEDYVNKIINNNEINKRKQEKQIFKTSITISINKELFKEENFSNLLKLFYSPNAFNVAALLTKMNNVEKYNYHYIEKNPKIRPKFLSSYTIGKLNNISSRTVFDIIKLLEEIKIGFVDYSNSNRKMVKQITSFLNQDYFNEKDKMVKENPLSGKKMYEQKERIDEYRKENTLRKKIETNSFFIIK